MRLLPRGRQSPAVLLVFAGLVAVATVSLARAEPTATDLDSLATLELRDQFGNRDSLAAHRGIPLIAIIVSVRRLAMIERWERDLTGRLPGVRFLNVADLPADAPVDLDRTAATLRKRVPDTVPVLMDPSRRWATVLGLDTDAPNLLVFDASGGLRQRFRGRWTTDLGATVAAAVAPLLGLPPASPVAAPVDPAP